jgi:hypothetical protein
MRSALLAALSCLVSLASAAAGECDVRILTSQDPLLTWRSVSYPGGKYASFTAGIGSGAARAPSDPSDSVYVIADRGPNFPCDDAEDIIGPESKKICPPSNSPEYKTTRIYPTPDYTPSIYRLELDRKQGFFTVKDVISLKTASGKSVSGLLNPQKVAETDKAIDLNGDCLPQDVNAVDAEAIARLSDGTFWIADEMGPSLLQVRADGRIIKRLVPKDAKEDYRGADMDIDPSLPAILSKRARNRGIEALAVSPDEQFLYFMLQSPLANPDEDTYKQSKNIRLFKVGLNQKEKDEELLGANMSMSSMV